MTDPPFALQSSLACSDDIVSQVPVITKDFPHKVLLLGSLVGISALDSFPSAGADVKSITESVSDIAMGKNEKCSASSSN